MLKRTLAATALFLSSQVMAAPIYEFIDNDADTGGAADYLESLSTTWDAGNQLLNWKTTFSSDAVDSFWLVINDGPNPKVTDSNELVIMYGDLNRGTVTSYVYNGANNANSYNTPGIYLQTDSLSVTGNSIEFDIDASAINAATVPGDYRGLVAGPEHIGIWFHVATGSQFGYQGDELTGYRFASQGWYDRAHLRMHEVPEPGTVALMGLGLISLIGMRRRRYR